MSVTICSPLFYGLSAEHVLDTIHSTARSIELLPEDPEYSQARILLQEAMNKEKEAHLLVYNQLINSGKVRQEELHTQEEEFFFAQDDENIPSDIFEPIEESV